MHPSSAKPTIEKVEPVTSTNSSEAFIATTAKQETEISPQSASNSKLIIHNIQSTVLSEANKSVTAENEPTVTNGTQVTPNYNKLKQCSPCNTVHGPSPTSPSPWMVAPLDKGLPARQDKGQDDPDPRSGSTGERVGTFPTVSTRAGRKIDLPVRFRSWTDRPARKTFSSFSSAHVNGLFGVEPCQIHIIFISQLY